MPGNKAKVCSPIEDAINRRFFEAIEELVTLGRLSALDAFCREAGLYSPRYREMRGTYGVTPRAGYVSRYKSLQAEAVYTLTAKFGVSADWLITGRGKMLRP